METRICQERGCLLGHRPTQANGFHSSADMLGVRQNCVQISTRMTRLGMPESAVMVNHA